MNDIFWLTIGMAVVTYLGRVSGYWFILFFKPQEKMQAFLRLVPGTLFMAMIAPQLFNSGWIGWLSGVIIFILAKKTNNMFIALIVGTAIFVGLQAMML